MLASTCTPHHDWFTATLTFGLCCGIIISYAPQHFRIIHKGSSEGFSPWFLLLGSTSSAAGLMNMVTMQWGIVRCCRVVSFGRCIEMTAGIVQVGLQWLLFTVIFVLYMLYYPPHLKYAPEPALTQPETQPLLSPKHTQHRQKSNTWRISILLAWATALHFAFIFLTTLVLLFAASSSPTPHPTPTVRSWATFLGVTSALLSATQYAPQVVHTYRLRLVGALSVPMMCIQSPGSVLMVLSIALRPGTNWTSWIMFAVAGIMQGGLLVMCIVWKYRQRRLGIDDFGAPLASASSASSSYSPALDSRMLDEEAVREVEPVPGLVADDTDPRVATRVLEVALQSAVAADVRDPPTPASALEPVETEAGAEDAPLLGGNTREEPGRWWGWGWGKR